MKFTSPDTFIHELNGFSGNSIKNVDDIRRLLECVIENSLWKELESAAFTGKFLHGIVKIIRKRDSLVDDEYFVKIKSEFSEGIERFKEDLKPIVEMTPDFYKTIFDEKFLAMTQTAFNNLNGLIEDFSLIKKYFNEKKFGQAARK